MQACSTSCSLDGPRSDDRPNWDYSFLIRRSETEAPRFSPHSLVAAFSALWCIDWQWPVVVRVDTVTRHPSIFASVETPPTPGSGPAGDDSRGPRSLAAGLGALWVIASRGDHLIRIDPTTGSIDRIVLPFPAADIAVGPSAVFAVSHRHGLIRVEPDGGIQSTISGPTLRLLAAAESFVWTVDDGSAAVMALDPDSLQVVRTFHHLGGPCALFALDQRAWYFARPEELLSPENGRQQRAGIMRFGRPEVDVLCCDAVSGDLREVGSWRATQASAMDAESFWVAGHSRESGDKDPATELRRMSLDGSTLLSVTRPGQIGAIALGGDIVWVSGFRRSRQSEVLNSLALDGSETGEVDLSGIDLTAWMRSPRARTTLSPGDRARAVRDAVEQCLSEPHMAIGRFGDEWEEPPIAPTFHLDRVELRAAEQAPEIVVLFRWDGENDLFGVKFPIPQGDPFDDSSDAYISVYVEENLLAAGFGVENAVRDHAEGVTWLSWRQWSAS